MTEGKEVRERKSQRTKDINELKERLKERKELANKVVWKWVWRSDPVRRVYTGPMIKHRAAHPALRSLS